MEQKRHSAKFNKQRKFLMVLPLLVLPFIILFFIALGGGKAKSEQSKTLHESIGLNMKLPDAHFKKAKEKDKLALYDEAIKDSIKLKEEIKNDPYYKLEFHNEDEVAANKTSELQSILQNAASKYKQPSFSKLKTSVGSVDHDPNEDKVMAKLALLKNELNKKPATSSSTSGDVPSARSTNSDVEKLENMMKAINSKNEADPELKQLSTMLDKIMLVQHPEKLSDSTQKNQPFAFPVKLTNDSTAENGFYGLADNLLAEKHNAIVAVIDEMQTLVSGDPISIRLLQDIYVQGFKIPKNEIITGTASFTNERLKVIVSSISYRNNIIPVSLEVYDMRGMAGIYIQGSMNRDVSKQSADQALSSLNFATLDPSIGAQAANAGIMTAKTLMSKKMKMVKVTVGPDYKLLLRDNSQK